MKYWALAAVCLGLVTACSSTGVGNPGVEKQELLLTTDDQVEPDAEDSELLDQDALRQALLVLGELSVLPCDANDSERVIRGPFVVDLVRGTIVPDLPQLSLPRSGACGLDAKLAPVERSGVLQGRSMLFSGLRQDGTLFVLVADVPGTLRLRPLPGLEWEVTGQRWLWALRPRRWILESELLEEMADSGSALDEVADAVDTANVERVIVINVNRHPVLYELIRTRLAARSTLHVDLNDNGALDAEERTGNALIGRGREDID